MKKYTLMINGGIGKHICATTMIRQIKEKELDARITTISGFPEVFLHNPNIYRNLHHVTSYVFDDYIDGTEFRSGEPYHSLAYYHNQKHISNIFPLAYGFKEENENIYPEIYLHPDELREAQDLINKSKNPVITIQATGGNQKMGQMKDPRQLTARDLLQPTAQKIVDICTKEGFNVIQVRLPHEYQLNDVRSFDNIPFRKYMALAPFIAGHIGNDSAMMHTVAAFKKPSLIFWGNTNSTALGYPYMTNVYRDKCPTPMCARPHVGMPDLAPEGSWQCPHKSVCLQWTDEEIEKYVSEFINKIKKEAKNVKRIPLGPGQDNKCSECLPDKPGIKKKAYKSEK